MGDVCQNWEKTVSRETGWWITFSQSSNPSRTKSTVTAVNSLERGVFLVTHLDGTQNNIMLLTATHT